MTSCTVSGKTFNTDKGERFTVPGAKGKDEYWLKIDQDTGCTKIYQSQWGIILDKEVGTYNPKTGDVTFNDKPGGATEDQKELFKRGSPHLITVAQKAEQTIVKDLVQQSGSTDQDAINEARIKASELLGDNKGLVNKDQEQFTGEMQKAGESIQGTRKNFGNYIYPLGLGGDKDQDVIKFTVLKYEPRGFKNPSNSSMLAMDDRGAMANRDPRGSVTLPAPSKIEDTNAVDWGEDSMNAVQAALANIGLEFLGGGDMGKAVGSTTDSMRANKDEIKKALGPAIVDMATGGTGQSLLTRSTGNIMNPNMELLFKKPTLRPFGFNFKLSPRSAKEARAVIQIIRLFKQAMAPIRSKSQFFLKSPHTFRLQYLNRNKSIPFLNQFKECALQNMTVNYTPDGNYATYEDDNGNTRSVVSYSMTLQFKEIEPVYNDDYDNQDDDYTSPSSIGNMNNSAEVPVRIGY
tara:strand:- start:39 stop:1424 length:1386 start_codon:yes stop_codon:yes gene_type:complete